MLSISLTLRCLSVCLPQFVCLYLNPSLFLSKLLSNNFGLLLSLLVCISVCLYLYLSVCVSISISLSVTLSISLFSISFYVRFQRFFGFYCPNIILCNTLKPFCHILTAKKSFEILKTRLHISQIGVGINYPRCQKWVIYFRLPFDLFSLHYFYVV